ncbi:MAG: 2OG-Fe(II) oxygenase [Pseudomonadota bacterium]|nr:2OG-Fe(II) oxygenase [Pseudomonadota bacterium]
MQKPNNNPVVDIQADAEEIPLTSEESRYRYISNHFVSPEECTRLINFADKELVLGDGYDGHANPHSETESFYGYTFTAQPKVKLTNDHLLALKVMQRARKSVMKHFRLPFLWLDFAHLVMRDPLESTKKIDSEALSHPWHYDDQADHIKHRTHTAILYLNDNFEGGFTQFKEQSFGPFRKIEPITGRLIAFKVAGNAHAVTKLIQGKRYVLNMWFSTKLGVWRRHRRIFKPL